MKSDKYGKRALNLDQLESLIAGGLIAAEDRDRVRAEFRGSIGWAPWLGRWSLGIGALLFTSGLVFFFAYNWKNLSPMVRFGSLEVAVTAAALTALFLGIQSPLGQWLLFGASIVAGVLVAVYGQVYQTGADAFEVFALWALLISAWVLVSRFAPLWLLWLMVVETALMLYWGQVIAPDGVASWDAAFILAGLFTAAVAAVRIWLAASVGDRFAWLRGAWMRFLLLIVTLGWLSIEPLRLIFDFAHRGDDAGAVVGTLIWLSMLAVCVWFYFMVRPSVAALGVCALCLATVLALAVGRIILEEFHDSAFAWLVVGVAAIGIFGGVGWLITRAGRLLSERKQAESGSENVPTHISTEAK